MRLWRRDIKRQTALENNMTITTHPITLGAVAAQFPVDAPGLCRVFVEPLRSNTNVSYVGVATVINDDSGTGVIQEIAVPSAATVPCDHYQIDNQSADNTVDPEELLAHGTAPAASGVRVLSRRL